MSFLKNKYGKVRSGWRISLVLFLSFVFQIISGILVGVAGSVFLGVKDFMTGTDRTTESIQTYLTEDPSIKMVINFLAMISVILAVVMVLKLVDKKKVRDIGFKLNSKSIKDLLIGLFLGAISMTAVFFVFKLTGNITVERGFNFSLYLLLDFILFVLVAINEELLSRGYCLYTLKEHNSEKFAVVVSSIIFSLLHIFNPNLKLFGLFNIFLVGVLFAYMTLKTGNIMMAIGYHITWNFFQGNIFGLSVSGKATDGIIIVSNIKDNIITGGAFGPEAGIVTTCVILIGFLFLNRFIKQDKILKREEINMLD